MRALLLQALHPRVIRGTLQNATAVTLPRWARRMYGRLGGRLTDIAASAGLRAARLAFSQQRLFLAAMRAVHRAEWAGETKPPWPGRAVP